MDGLLALMGVSFVVGMVMFAIAQHAKQKKKIGETLSALAQNLGGRVDHEAQRVSATVAGTDIEFRFVTRGSGKHTQHWTEIGVELPAKYPLTIFVRKHGWRDASKIAAGEMVDVQVGNAAFDARFLVEAAPADVARVLFDDRACSYLLKLEQGRWLEVATKEEGPRRWLRLDVREWLDDDFNLAQAGIEAIAAIAGRVRDAYSAVERAPEQSGDGSPFRPMLEDKAARRAADARVEEVARVEKIRTEREARERMFAIVMLVLFLVAGAVIVAASGAR